MQSLPKLLFYVVVVALLFRATGTYFGQRDLELITTEEVFPWYFQLIFISNVLMTIGSVGSFLLYNRYFPRFVNICYVLMIVLVLICCKNDLEIFKHNPSKFYGVKSPGVFINFGLMYFAANILYFPKILKVFYYLCFVFIFGGLLNVGTVGGGASRENYLNVLREFAVYLIWVSPFFFIQEEQDKKINLLNYLILSMTFLFVLFIGARSYLLIFFIFLFIKFKRQLQSKNAVFVIAGTSVLILIIGIVLLNSGLEKTIQDTFKILSNRTADDSRSEQIFEFLHQYDTDYLMQGVGPVKTWYWSSTGEYSYLDNQFLLLAWWAGLPTLLVYLFFLAKVYFHKSENYLFGNFKGIKLILLLWVLACMGLAIYVNICSQLYYYFISCMIGLHTCYYSKINDLQIEEI